VSFKEQIQKDLTSVFLNLDEFAEFHRVEGQRIPVVIDEDVQNRLAKVGDNRIHGMIEADMVLMAKESDLPKSLEPGRLLNIDGRELIVVTSSKHMGLIEVELRQNRTQ
jgi:hypothetical protein